MVKYNQTIRRQKPTNCLSLFDHFMGLALKELTRMAVQQGFEDFFPCKIIIQANLDIWMAVPLTSRMYHLKTIVLEEDLESFTLTF